MACLCVFMKYLFLDLHMMASNFFTKLVRILLSISGLLLISSLSADPSVYYSGQSVTHTLGDSPASLPVDVNSDGTDDFRFTFNNFQLTETQYSIAVNFEGIQPAFVGFGDPQANLFRTASSVDAFFLGESWSDGSGIASSSTILVSESYSTEFSSGTSIQGFWGEPNFSSPVFVNDDNYIMVQFGLDSSTSHYGFVEAITSTNVFSGGSDSITLTIGNVGWETTAGVEIAAQAVPEPSTVALFALGLAGLYLVRRRM